MEVTAESAAAVVDVCGGGGGGGGRLEGFEVEVAAVLDDLELALRGLEVGVGG